MSIYADPNCPNCGGRGFLYEDSMLDGGRACHCALDALREENMGRIWATLPSAINVPQMRDSPDLKEFLKEDLWITAKDNTFKAHLKALAYNMSDMWDARVYSDKDLVEAWLRTAKAQGHKIYDSEIENHEGAFYAMDIAELVEPPSLVVIRTGVKLAANRETPNVCLEALSTRQHLGRPTWILDQPDHPISDESHRAYSCQLHSLLAQWKHVSLRGGHIDKIHGFDAQGLDCPSGWEDGEGDNGGHEEAHVGGPEYSVPPLGALMRAGARSLPVNSVSDPLDSPSPPPPDPIDRTSHLDALISREDTSSKKNKFKKDKSWKKRGVR